MRHPSEAFRNRIARREDASLRDRVLMYLLVMLFVDLMGYVSDYVMPLLMDGLSTPDTPLSMRMLRWTSTALVVGGVAVTRFARPGPAVCAALESTVTVALAVVYVHIADWYMVGPAAGYAAVFAMFGILLVLSVRAALVPSPVIRTVAIGAVSTGALFLFQWEGIRALDPEVLDGLTFIGGAFVVATGVTSHVIYGLRRQVTEALQLGQYTLEEKLGEGGMGAVYRARHAMLRRNAAIKLVRGELTGDGTRGAQALARFEREAQITASLTSPHTIRLYDFGVSAEGTFYYVMELLDGINLDDVVRRYGPLPPERAVHLLRQACESLEEAHRAGLVHRDVKPANLFLTRQGTRHDFVKVLDFGLVAMDAPAAGGDPKLTDDGKAFGTPAYLPPEMVSGPDGVDGRADVYAVGCVAYWLLTGHAPFERETAMATVVAHVHEAPAAPSSVSELAIPDALDALVLACLAKDPAARPASAAELARRLGAAVEGVPAWDEARAARWWETHRPEPEGAPERLDRDATVAVTRAAE